MYVNTNPGQYYASLFIGPAQTQATTDLSWGPSSRDVFIQPISSAEETGVTSYRWPGATGQGEVTKGGYHDWVNAMATYRDAANRPDAPGTADGTSAEAGAGPSEPVADAEPETSVNAGSTDQGAEAQGSAANTPPGGSTSGSETGTSSSGSRGSGGLLGSLFGR